MTLGNLRTAVRERLDDPTFDTIKLDRWINWVLQDIYSRADFPFKNKTVNYATTDGTNAHNLTDIAADMDKVSRVLDTTNAVELQYCTPEEFNDFSLTTTEENKPAYWTVFGDQLKLYPTPDAAYTLQIEYKAALSDLTDASQSPTLPDRWSEIIVLGAYAKALEWNDDFDYAGAIMIQFERMLARMIQSSSKTSGQTQVIDWYRPEI